MSTIANLVVVAKYQKLEDQLAVSHLDRAFPVILEVSGDLALLILIDFLNMLFVVVIGRCSGTPPGCQDCLGICESRGTGRHTERATGGSSSGGSNFRPSNSGGFGGSFGSNSNSGGFGDPFGSNSNSGGSNFQPSNSGGFGGSFGGSSSQTKTCFEHNSDGSTRTTKQTLHNDGGTCRLEVSYETCDRNRKCLGVGKRRRRSIAEVSCDTQLT